MTSNISSNFNSFQVAGPKVNQSLSINDLARIVEGIPRISQNASALIHEDTPIVTLRLDTLDTTSKTCPQ
jgi:hypothetical protein